MKKVVVLALLLVMVAVTAQARDLTSGTVKLSGATNASFVNTTEDYDGDEESDTDILTLETSAVYFLTKNIGIGGTVGYQDISTDFTAGSTEERTTTLIAPTVAFDLPITDSLNFIADASVGYFKMEGEDSGGTWDADGLVYGASAGVAMFPAKQVSLDLTAAYEVLDGKDDADVDVKFTSMGVNLGVSVYFD